MPKNTLDVVEWRKMLVKSHKPRIKLISSSKRTSLTTKQTKFIVLPNKAEICPPATQFVNILIGVC